MKKISDYNTGLYIHLPFCRSKCPYCSFYSIWSEYTDETYIEYICAEIELSSNSDFQKLNPIDTIYMGGGTPSLMSIYSLDVLLSRIWSLIPYSGNWADLEITLEMNPEDANKDYLSEIRKLNINRISLGLQRMDDQLLATLGRKNRVIDNLRALENIKEAGFDNLSIDLIIGVQDDSSKKIENELKQIMQFNPGHISIYMLEIKEGTRFAKLSPDTFPDDDRLADIYLFVLETLKNKGFEQYEISNFAKPEMVSKHNIKYWDFSPWIGLGASSTSFNGKITWENPKSIEKYYEQILIRAEHPKSNQTIESKQPQLSSDAFMMGMRKREGVHLESFSNRWAFSFNDAQRETIESFKDSGFLMETEGYLSFTDKGILMSNAILAEILL